MNHAGRSAQTRRARRHDRGGGFDEGRLASRQPVCQDSVTRDESAHFAQKCIGSNAAPPGRMPPEADERAGTSEAMFEGCAICAEQATGVTCMVPTRGPDLSGWLLAGTCQAPLRRRRPAAG
jgi:hypothetical protein